MPECAGRLLGLILGGSTSAARFGVTVDPGGLVFKLLGGTLTHHHPLLRIVLRSWCNIAITLIDEVVGVIAVSDY
jgi:hypothetical protein